MLRQQIPNSLQFKDDLIVANQVGTISLAKRDSVIGDLNFCLRFKWYASSTQFPLEAFLIYRLKESCPHPLIDCKYRPLNDIRFLRIYYSAIHGHSPPSSYTPNPSLKTFRVFRVFRGSLTTPSGKSPSGTYKAARATRSISAPQSAPRSANSPPQAPPRPRRRTAKSP